MVIRRPDGPRRWRQPRARGRGRRRSARSRCTTASRKWPAPAVREPHVQVRVVGLDADLARRAPRHRAPIRVRVAVADERGCADIRDALFHRAAERGAVPQPGDRVVNVLLVGDGVIGRWSRPKCYPSQPSCTVSATGAEACQGRIPAVVARPDCARRCRIEPTDRQRIAAGTAHPNETLWDTTEDRPRDVRPQYVSEARGCRKAFGPSRMFDCGSSTTSLQITSTVQRKPSKALGAAVRSCTSSCMSCTALFEARFDQARIRARTTPMPIMITNALPSLSS